MGKLNSGRIHGSDPVKPISQLKHKDVSAASRVQTTTWTSITHTQRLNYEELSWSDLPVSFKLFPFCSIYPLTCSFTFSCSPIWLPVNSCFFGLGYLSGPHGFLGFHDQVLNFPCLYLCIHCGSFWIWPGLQIPLLDVTLLLERDNPFSWSLLSCTRSSLGLLQPLLKHLGLFLQTTLSQFL